MRRPVPFLAVILLLASGCGSARQAGATPSERPSTQVPCFAPVPADAPASLPVGYRFRARVVGPNTGSFPRHPNQVTWIFNRGCAADDFPYPLMVSRVPEPNVTISAAENHLGEPVDLGRPGTAAVYHDGLWAPGPGPEQWTLGSVTLHWEASAVHSLTVHWSGGTFGIRGARTHGVTREDLIRIGLALKYP